MARRSAQTKTAEREPASLPEVLIPPSEAPDAQRSAYWLELMDNPQEFRKAVASEEFFPMLREFPEAFWGGRLSLYLYRLPDSEGLLVKNAEGEKKYIKVVRVPIDEEWVAQRYGGGKYMLYLKLDSKETLRQHTFPVDGPPKMQPGQVVEIDGKNVSVGGASSAPAPVEDNGNAVSKVIDASAKANESAMGILAHASETAIDMVKAQATRENAPAANPVTQLVELAAALKSLMPAPPVADPVMAEVMKQIVAKAFAEPKQNPEQTEKPTPLNDTLAVIKDLTGAESIAELLKPPARAAAADVTPAWVSPLLQLGQTLIQSFPAIMAQSRATRDLEFRRMLFLRDSKPGQAVPQTLLAEPAPPAPPQPAAQPPTIPAAPTGPMQPQEVVQGIITMICHGFDKDPRQGYETAAAIAYNFGDAIDSLGFGKTLGSEAEVIAFITGLQPLQQRSQDARWPMFQKDFLNYSIDRWGTDEERERWENLHGEEEEQPPAA